MFDTDNGSHKPDPYFTVFVIVLISILIAAAF